MENVIQKQNLFPNSNDILNTHVFVDGCMFSIYVYIVQYASYHTVFSMYLMLPLYKD